MVRIIAVVVLAVCAWWIVRRRWIHERRLTAPVPAERMSHEILALEAFMRGNGCLREGQLDEARTAYYQARALDPKLSYVVAGLAEVERQQTSGVCNAAYLTRYPRVNGIGYTQAP